jgi:hypothetical protein
MILNRRFRLLPHTKTCCPFGQHVFFCLGLYYCGEREGVVCFATLIQRIAEKLKNDVKKYHAEKNVRCFLLKMTIKKLLCHGFSYTENLLTNFRGENEKKFV